MHQHRTLIDADGQTAALRLTGLHKQFGETTAVDHLDLAVPRGVVLRAGRAPKIPSR